MDLISTTIRIQHNAVPAHLEGSDNDMTCGKITAELGRFGVRADVSDVISHIKIELPSAHLANACAALVASGIIRPLKLGAIGQS